MIIKLADIVAVMKDKWTYGDKFFGYTDEFNDNHNTVYPSMLITPPKSVFPEVFSNNGWENYEFEIYFSELYNRTQQQNESIEQRWQNLQDLSTEWLDNFLKHYQSNPNNFNPAPLYAFLDDASVTVERNKEVANDQLLQIKLTFTWRVMSKCFNPVSTYPNEIENLAIWLKADSLTTHSIPTKKVSVWGDMSGNNNNTDQMNSDSQPLRYTYNGADDKTRLQFDGVNDSLKSVAFNPISNTRFTAFTVAQAEGLPTGQMQNDYSTRFEGGAAVVDCGNPASGIPARPQMFSFTDGAGTDTPFSFSLWTIIDPTQPWRGWIQKKDLSSNDEWELNCIYANGYTILKLTDSTTGGTISIRDTTTIPKGEWVHIVGTYDGSGLNTGLNIYMDGQLKSVSYFSSGTYNGMQLGTAPFEIGKSPNAMVGTLDEVSMFDKELTLAEVQELWNSGNPTDLTTHSQSAAVIGWWRMGDGATFPTIPDEINGNDGTMDSSMSQQSFEEFTPSSQKGEYYSYENGNILISIGSRCDRPYFRLNDTTSYPYAGEWNVRINREKINSTSNYHMLTSSFSDDGMELQTNDNTPQFAAIDSGWSDPVFNAVAFEIGTGSTLGKLKGNIQEVIVYNRALEPLEKEKVKNYLNKKYKIY